MSSKDSKEIPVVDALDRIIEQARLELCVMIPNAPVEHIEIFLKAILPLSDRVKSDQNGFFMRQAALSGRDDIIEFFANMGNKSIDIPTSLGRTAMHEAALKGHSSTVEFLARIGSTALNTRDIVGRTPLHCAALSGDLNTVRTLVILGANINERTNSGSLPISMALSIKCHEIVDFLTELGSEKPDKDDEEKGVQPACNLRNACASFPQVEVGEDRIL